MCDIPKTKKGSGYLVIKRDNVEKNQKEYSYILYFFLDNTKNNQPGPFLSLTELG